MSNAGGTYNVGDAVLVRVLEGDFTPYEFHWLRTIEVQTGGTVTVAPGTAHLPRIWALGGRITEKVPGIHPGVWAYKVRIPLELDRGYATKVVETRDLHLC